jgi:hypothetical protein
MSVRRSWRWQELRGWYQRLIEMDERRIATSEDFIEYYRAGIPSLIRFDHNVRVVQWQLARGESDCHGHKGRDT